ncbi:hypothetical protein HNQ79_006324 [Streptomyces candidus]|uniref:Uncharacterized protein n=1 Tax=Streptomyces candidus TaxID=67283 RepID=A0A7X0LT28_9ACTN|nr:hypothetical protein [Streptomyces candidus]
MTGLQQTAQRPSHIGRRHALLRSPGSSPPPTCTSTAMTIPTRAKPHRPRIDKRMHHRQAGSQPAGTTPARPARPVLRRGRPVRTATTRQSPTLPTGIMHLSRPVVLDGLFDQPLPGRERRAEEHEAMRLPPPALCGS